MLTSQVPSRKAYVNIPENARISVLGAALLMAIAACSPYDGKLPPENELYYPTALKLHPSGDFLYVLNSNFDSEYRVDLGGTLTVVDLETRRILPEFTMCLPSFGGSLLFSGTSFDDGSPRYLFASTRANDAVVGFHIDESDPRRLTCPAKTAQIANTCVSNITDLPNVSDSKRELPCSVYNVVDDPNAMALVPNDGPRLDSLDAVAVAGTRQSEIRVINFLNGEARGESGQGNLNRDQHVSGRVAVTSGPSAMSFNPLTHDLYVAPRFSRALSIVRFLFRDEVSQDDNRLDGFVATGATVDLVNIGNASNSAEIRSLAFNAAGTRLYASQQSPSAILVVDVTLDDDDEPVSTVIDRIPMPGRPGEIILRERAGVDYLFVSLFNDREVAIVNLSTREIVRRVKVGESPYDLELDDDRSLLYVALFADHSVGVIDVDPSSADFGQIVSTIR